MSQPGWDQAARERVAEDKRRGRRGLLPVALAVGLLALAAAGSLRGPLGSGRGRPSYPADLIDSLLLVLLVAVVATLVLVVVVLAVDRPRLVGRRRRHLVSVGMFVPVALIVGLWLFQQLFGLGEGQDDPAPTTTAPPVSAAELPSAPPAPGPVPLLVAGLAVLTLVAVVAGQLQAERRRRRPPKTPAERLVELLDDTLEDLEREPDPRRAVIAAWARMERGLAAAGLPRRPAEAPFEYAARALESAWRREPGRAGPGAVAVHRLTALFERAKFSRHAIGPADREEAVAALRAVRAELARAAEPAAAAAPGPRP
jgi:hypothetical protein